MEWALSIQGGGPKHIIHNIVNPHSSYGGGKGGWPSIKTIHNIANPLLFDYIQWPGVAHKNFAKFLVCKEEKTPWTRIAVQQLSPAASIPASLMRNIFDDLYMYINVYIYT